YSCKLQITSVLTGIYTVSETVPQSGYALYDDTDRLITVTGTDLNPVIGTQGSDDPGNTNESDFHNRLGSISWEKRIDVSGAPLHGGAVFVIHLDPKDDGGILPPRPLPPTGNRIPEVRTHLPAADP